MRIAIIDSGLKNLWKNIWKKYGDGDDEWIINTGTFEKITLTENYTIPTGVISTLNCPDIEAILCVEGVLELISWVRLD